MRIDKYLVENNLTPSRTYAENLVLKGKVKIDGRVISKPSHNFLIVMAPGFWLFSLRMLYTVEGETPEMFASSFTAMFRSSQS